MTGDGAELPARRRRRWGLRAIGFLVLAMVAVVTAMAMGHHTIGTLGSLLFGICGAAYCSVQGLRETLARARTGQFFDRRHQPVAVVPDGGQMARSDVAGCSDKGEMLHVGVFLRTA